MTPQNSLGIIIGALVAIIVLLVTGGIYYTTVVSSDAKDGKKTEQASVPSKIQEREEVVKKIVASFLKSPGSAQFPDLIVKKMSETEDHYIAFGEVDSQNGFGALLRTHFHLILIYNGGEITDVENWTIDALGLGEKLLITDGEAQDPPLPLTGKLLEAVQRVEDIYRGMEQFDVEGIDLRN